MYRFENYLFICVFYKISEYIEGFQIIFFLPHLKFVKNIAFFYLYLLLFIFLEDHFAISFIIFSTSEISISSISAICSIENLLDNFFTNSVFSFDLPICSPSAIPSCFISIFSRLHIFHLCLFTCFDLTNPSMHLLNSFTFTYF